MAKKRAIKIELTEKEDALVYYERICGRNESIKKHAKVLYYANQGVASLGELCELSGLGKVAVNKVLNEFKEAGVDVIYNCARGKRINHLDKIGDELEAYFDEDPPLSVPDAVRKIRKNFNLNITETPVRYWLKAKAIRTKNQKVYPQKRT